MKQVCVDISKVTGKIKPMHGVNSGPFELSNGLGTKACFKEAGIPYVRNHDSSESIWYGDCRGNDVMYIFTDFDADENDPNNYDWYFTDRHCLDTNECGGEMFFRLGTRIEGCGKNYNTYPPKDFHKWARICEHIMAHYLEGWSNGPILDLKYWEIWNEADGYHEDGTNACWQGTIEEFYEFYAITAKHLKERFPDRKIGGPAFTGAYHRRYMIEGFIAYVKEHDVPLDFFSWHGYRSDTQDYVEDIAYVRNLLDQYGFTETELIMSEWNYVKGWDRDDIVQSYRAMANEKGAAFNAACMLAVQKTPLDMFMYYDARPDCSFNGLFAPYTFEPLKGYYAFWQFNKLYELKNEAASETDSEAVYVGAAVNDDNAAVQLAYYSEKELENETVAVRLKGLNGMVKITVLQTDKDHTNEKTHEYLCKGPETTLYFDLKLHSTMLLTVEPA